MRHYIMIFVLTSPSSVLSLITVNRNSHMASRKKCDIVQTVGLDNLIGIAVPDSPSGGMMLIATKIAENDPMESHNPLGRSRQQSN